MTGCLWGSSYQMTKKDARGRSEPVRDPKTREKILLIKCGKLVAPGEDYCPKHQMMRALQAAK